MIDYIKSKKGAIGIGTLIIFIALVLVAAVAAAVIINTAGHLQQKAAATGRESTEQVASGINIVEIQGMHNKTNINKLAILITPNAGSAPIDLKHTVVMISDGKKKLIARYNETEPDYFDLKNGGLLFSNVNWTNLNPTEFGIVVILDADGSCQNTTPVINKGDIVAIVLNTTTLDTSPRSTISGEIQPEFGAPGIISFTTPSTYLVNIKIIRLQ